jgi:hypothetical protein
MDEPDQAPPWNPADGPGPAMWTWLPHERPAMSVLIDGHWVHATVTARAEYRDGRVAFHVVLTPPGESGGTHRAYWYPQDDKLRTVGDGGGTPTRVT